MNWNQLDSIKVLDELVRDSQDSPQIIFKHSARCSISFMVLDRLQQGLPAADYHLLDVIGKRELSDKVAKQFSIMHQSPQLLIIHKGICVYDTSHYNISSSVVDKEINLLQKS